MGTKYTSQSASGYNSSPPPDDGSVTAANKLTWAKIKTALADSIKTLADGINTQLTNALNYAATSTSVSYTTVAGDHEQLIEASTSITISLGDAATMGAGYKPGVYNKGTAVVTVALITAANTLNGNANGTVKLLPGQAMWFVVNQAVNGYDITKAGNREPITLTGSAGTNAITAGCDSVTTGISSGQLFVLTPANANTGPTTLAITPSGGAALTAKNIFWKGAALVGRELQASIPVILQYDGTQFNILDGASNTLTVLRGYLAGLTLSTAGSSTTMTTAAGQAADSTNAILMSLAASIGKTTSAWAVGSGNGGLDTGAIANSTWYHFYLIQRLDTGVVDVLFSLSASAPTMPASYSFKRRIGSGKTDGSGNWTAFVQDGDFFQWLSIAVDVAANNPGTAAVSRTLTVPTGVRVQALMNAGIVLTTTAGIYYGLLSDLSVTDVAVTSSNANMSGFVDSATDSASFFSQCRIMTNTSAQIRSRLATSSAAVQLNINTAGWIDRRGQDA